MNQAYINDGNLTHAVINHLNALYRGKLAFLNALMHLKYRAFQQSELTDTKKAIEAIQRWFKELWQGMPLLSVSWKDAETFDAKRSFDLLNEIKLELTAVLEEISKIIKSPERFSDEEHIKFQIAAHIRSSYSRENFLKGLVEYGTQLQRDDIAKSYQPQADLAAQEVAAANNILKEYISGKELSNNFFEGLSFATNLLPNHFRMSLHDINHLLSVFDPEFTFEMAGIHESNAALWREMKLNAHQAGYWHAFDIQPDEARQWIELSVTDPLTAGSFKHYGFSQEEAVAWLELGLEAEVAFIWQRSGFQPKQTIPFIQKGIYLPIQASAQL